MNDLRPFDPAGETYVSLATYRRNGAEVRTPVWIARGDDRYYVFSAGDAGKVKRIRVTPRVRLAACDLRGNVKSAWIDGEARLITEPTGIAAALQALRRKYGLQMRLTDFFAKLSGRFQKRAYIEISLKTHPETQ
ncbi:PPOX class F420-dependent oxidoreductase [Povalibacter sp.]|uniref:PPOX class F420-dependent oxidoreductase n=1 Tax=Povalibacter sp. TaxID=1962978 RepID=UPI002F3E5A49